MKSKDEMIDELIINIKEYSHKIKQLRETKKQKLEEIKTKEKISKQKREEKKMVIQLNSELREKLDQANRINKGEANVVPDFKINPDEVLNFIPSTPLDGIKKIKENLNELRDTLKNQSVKTIEKKERPYVCCKYMGQNLKYMIPENPEYLFSHFLEDSTLFFNLKTEDFYLKDESNCVWSLSTPVLEYLNENPEELQLFLTKKNQNLNKKKKEVKKVEQDGMTQTVLKIEHLLKLDRIEKSNLSVEQKEEKTIKKNNMMKANRENEIILMIEKTFGERIVSLFFYIFFMFVVMFSVLKKNDVSIYFQIFQVLENELYKNEFMVNFTIFDYYTKDNDTNKDGKNYTYYQVFTDLSEMYDIVLLETWMKEVYFKKLSFIDGGRYQFMEMHNLIGPIRFHQVRQKKDENCQPFTKTVIDPIRTRDLYCYGSYTQAEKNVTFSGGSVSKGELDLQRKCAIDFKASAACAFFDGLYYRDIDRSYSYAGEFESYDLSGGFYFDLSPNLPMSQDDINALSSYVSHQWIDLATRLIVITFNAYQSDLTDNTIFSVTLYIEISNSMLMIKNFEVRVFRYFINFEILLRDWNKGAFNAIFNFIKSYFIEFFYLLLLLLYSFISLKAQLNKLIREKTNIIYKDFTVFVINVSIGGIIFTVLLFRIIYLITQIVTVNEFKQNGFNEFFPVNYFTDNLGFIVTLLEILMVSAIALNFLTAFYSEFYEQIFLIFGYSFKYLFSFLFFYLFIVLSYAACCTVIYGSIILSKKYLIFFTILDFSSLVDSIMTMILFIKIDHPLFEKMIEYYPSISYIIIVSYLVLVIILINLNLNLGLCDYFKSTFCYSS